jgi:hypothetical protein
VREGSVQRRVWLALGRICALFRLNTGQAWVSGGGPVQRLADGSVLVPAARPVALGLGKPDGKPLVGAADLIGWTSMTITPDMVGCRVAVFTALEVKETAGGRKRDEQRNFIDQVRLAGGIASFVSSPEEAEHVVCGFRAPLIKKDVGAG